MNRYIHDINKTQYKALLDFKELILQKKTLTDFNMWKDDYLLRFLRARKFDVDKSHLMFNDFITWRKDLDVDNIEEVMT